MAIVINGSGTVTGISVGGLPDDIVDSGTLANDVVVSTSGAITTTGAFTSIGIDDNADATAITINSSENVGIGVTPEVWNTDYDGLQIGNTGSLAGYSGSGIDRVWVTANGYVDDNDGSWQYINTDTASQHEQRDGKHNFFVAPSGSADATISWTTAMTIDNDGETHILSTSRVDSGDDGLSLGVLGKGFIRFANNGTGSQTNVQFYNSNGNVGTIVTSGSATAYNTSSDYRLKENVVPMTGSIDRLKELKPNRFNFIADATTTVDGFLAHEVSDIVPEAISGEKDAMQTEEYEVEPAVLDDDGEVVTEAVMGEREVIDAQGIDQSKLVPLLTGALQEAVAKIEELTTRIETLENA